MDQGSTMKRSAVHNFAPTVTKFCVMWEGQALPHDTKFGNSRCEIVGRRVIFIWSLIHGLRWSGLIKAELGQCHWGEQSTLTHLGPTKMAVAIQTCSIALFWMTIVQLLHINLWCRSYVTTLRSRHSGRPLPTAFSNTFPGAKIVLFDYGIWQWLAMWRQNIEYMVTA